MDSPSAAAWIAHGVFWTLIIVGWSELQGRRAAVFLGLWVVAFLARPYVPYGAALFAPYVAVLDIALAFVVLKGDVRLN